MNNNKMYLNKTIVTSINKKHLAAETHIYAYVSQYVKMKRI